MTAVSVQCVNPNFGLYNLRATTGDAHVVLAVSEDELASLIAAARDARAERARWLKTGHESVAPLSPP